MKNDITGEPPSPTKHGGEEHVPGAKRDGTEPEESTVEGTLAAFKVIVDNFNPYASRQPEFPLQIPGQLEFRA